MTRRMFRYVVRVDDLPHTFDLACGGYSGPLHVAASRVAYAESDIHVVEFWAEHDPDAYTPEPRSFQVFGTGHIIPDEMHWVGTCDRTADGLVWHLYEVLP
jgi:hypothetical protein